MKKRAKTPGNADIMKLKLHAPKIRSLLLEFDRVFGRPSLDNSRQALDLLDSIIQEARSLRKVAERIRGTHVEHVQNESVQNMREYRNWLNEGMDMPDSFVSKIEEPEEMSIPKAKEPVLASKKEASALKLARVDYVYLGSAPTHEDCAQVGDEDYAEKVREELFRYRQLLEHKFGTPPSGAAFRQKKESHDFGSYYEMAVAFDPNDAEALAFALFVEDNAPLNWSDTEKVTFNFEEGQESA